MTLGAHESFTSFEMETARETTAWDDSRKKKPASQTQKWLQIRTREMSCGFKLRLMLMLISLAAIYCSKVLLMHF